MIEGGDIDAHLDLYFRRCSLLGVTSRDRYSSGAAETTLANGGINPVARKPGDLKPTMCARCCRSRTPAACTTMPVAGSSTWGCRPRAA
ncbi:MAG: hypothetical protein IPK28_10795 [Devosia sp.]|nr:hypothetical protein [Devosia sp.]